MDEYPIPEPESEWLITDGVFFKRVGRSWARLTLSRSCLVTFTNVTGVLYFALIALTVTSSKLRVLIRESWFFV